MYPTDGGSKGKDMETTIQAGGIPQALNLVYRVSG